VIAQSSLQNKALASALCFALMPGVIQALEFPGSGLPGALALLTEARVAEKNSNWFRAAELYGQLSKQNPTKSAFRNSQIQCLRRSRFVQRREDRLYQQYVEQLSPNEAVQILTDVLSRLQQSYVDARAVSLERLFRAGIEELEFEMRDPAFGRRYLPQRTVKRLADFGAYLHARLEHIPRKPADLLGVVQELASRGAEMLGMRQELLILEFAAGACNGLDEYSFLMTPGTEANGERTPESLSESSVSEPRFLEMGSRIGYLRIGRFDAKTVAQLDDGVARLSAAGLRVLILDLRGNGGGLLSAAVDVADRFIASGVLVTTRGQVREYNRIYKAKGNANVSVPLIVLIDGETASSAELVAAALHDLQRGTVVGQRSFGKGTIQETVHLRGGIGVSVTVARFSTPRGQAVDAAGVEPDVVVLRNSEDPDMALDAQLHAALDLAHTMSAMGP
jgi:Peptidase family S41